MTIVVFPKIGIPQNGWGIMENPIKMDDLGIPLFLETPICNFPRLWHKLQVVTTNTTIHKKKETEGSSMLSLRDD